MAPKGQKLTLEQRRNIARGISTRYREVIEEGTFIPPEKRCTKCGQKKKAEDFYLRKRKLKSGIYAERLESACLACNAVYHKEKRATEGESHRIKQRLYSKRWRASLSPQKKRILHEKSREQAAARRRQEGRRANGSTKLKYGVDKEIPAGPLREWLKKESGVDCRCITLLAEQTGVSARRIGALIREEQLAVRLSTVDRILLGLGSPHLLQELYPLED